MFERFLSFVYICSSAFCVYFNLMTTYNSSLKFEIMAKQLYVASQRVL